MKMIYCTCSSEVEAKSIAHTLIRKKLAACCNIISGSTGIYEWEGVIKEDPECIILIKTIAKKIAEVRAVLLEMHSYDCPAIIELKTGWVDEPSLRWLNTRING